MGSILISDVGHHFAHNMLGASSHQHQPREAPTGPNYPIAASARSSQSSATYPYSHGAGPKDSPASSLVSPPTIPNPSGHPPRQCGDGNFAHAGTVPSHVVDAAASIKTPRLPQSPRVGGGILSPQQRGHGAQAATRTSGIDSSSSSSPQQSPSRSVRSVAESGAGSPPRIKVLSLSHIQSFATDQSSQFSPSRSNSRRSRRGPGDAGPQYEISEMPVTDIIEMVAGLLTKITTTNDRQHEHLHRQIPTTEGAGGLSQQTASVLAFHGKNIPSITILSYLSRIHKYCPTTYEVFLSLLVYFDRMTERVNSGPIRSMRQATAHERGEIRHSRNNSAAASSSQMERSSPTPNISSYLQSQSSVPASSSAVERSIDESVAVEQPPSSPLVVDPPPDIDPYSLSHFFVVDSFNIHRLVIAGVTCASKFFSDVFYTNSRYAKVGGLPLAELNHLELQFLLLNDFRLSIPIEEMEAYGTMLVEFYAREVVAQQHAHQSGGGHHGDGGAQAHIVSS